jgi:CRP/FNR family transcriptional regulator, cyclic AMP receptor protein
LAPFADLDDASLAALARVSSVRRYGDGEIIALEGDTDAPAFFVLRGGVRVFRTNLEGREQTLIMLREGEGMNLPAAFADSRSTPASAAALGDIEVLMIRLDDLRDVTRRHSPVAQAMLRHLSNRLQHLSGLVHDLSLLSVRARLARFLLAQSRDPSDVPMRWTHAQIAARIGTVRVVVSRTLSALADEGVVRLNRQRIEIVDPKALREIAEV